MIIYINGQQLSRQALGRAVLRSDSAPIPITLEAVVRWKVAVGDTVSVLGAEMTVEQVEAVSGQEQGGVEMSSTRLFAVLSGVRALAHPAKRCVNEETSNLSQCLAASGCRARITGDFPVDRFTVLRGQHPSFMTAMALQDAGAILRWKKGLEAVRIDEGMRRAPVAVLPDTAVLEEDAAIESEADVPLFFTLSANTSAATPVDGEGRIAYAHRRTASTDQLLRLSTILRRAGTLRIAQDTRIAAGDVVDLMGDRLMVITAAHVLDGQSQYTKLWVGKP